jgi:hypothetical protein
MIEEESAQANNIICGSSNSSNVSSKRSKNSKGKNTLRLAYENIRLEKEIEIMTKELKFLTSIIVEMTPDHKLPEYLDKLIKNIDN